MSSFNSTKPSPGLPSSHSLWAAGRKVWTQACRIGRDWQSLYYAAKLTGEAVSGGAWQAQPAKTLLTEDVFFYWNPANYIRTIFHPYQIQTLFRQRNRKSPRQENPRQQTQKPPDSETKREEATYTFRFREITISQTKNSPKDSAEKVPKAKREGKQHTRKFRFRRLATGITDPKKT